MITSVRTYTFLALMSMLCFGCLHSDKGKDADNDPSGGAGGEAGQGGAGGEAGSGGDGGDAGNEGGTAGTGGGEAGSAGSGGSTPTSGPNCGSLSFVNMNEAATVNGDRYVLEGNTAGRNNFQGSCEPQTEGSDMAIRFELPAAGLWEFSTEASAYDTVLYARSACEDAESELDCNDDINYEAGLIQSRVQVEGEAGDYVFLIVDAYDNLDPQNFTLEASPFIATEPPMIDSVDVFIDTASSKLGVIVRGVDVEEDVTSVLLNVFDADGEGLLADAEDVDLFPFDSVTYAEDGSHAFEGRLSVILNGDLSIITSAVGGAEDAENNRSNLVDATLGTPEVSLLDGACDGISLICDETTACVEGVCADPGMYAECPGDWPVLDVELDASGTTIILGDNTEAVGLRQGSCGGGGATVIYRLVSTQEVAIRATTSSDEDGADTVLFARRLCDLDGSLLGQDLACNDDIFFEQGSDNNNFMSQIEFLAPQGEPVFIFVDGYTDQMNNAWQGNYTLTLETLASPTLDQASAVKSTTRDIIGVKVSGQHNGSELRSLAVTLTGDNMPIIIADSTELLIPGNFIVTDEMYAGEAFITLPEGITKDMVTALQVSVVDSIERRTEVISVDMFDAPTSVDSGGACDPNAVFSVCSSEGERCYTLRRSGEMQEPVNGEICQVATAPTISDADYLLGQLNNRDGFLVRVSATDADFDIAGIGLELLDQAGARLIESDDVPFFDISDQAFTGNEFFYEGGFLLEDSVEPSEIGGIRVTLIDSAGLTSDAFVASVGEQAILPVDAPCDPANFANICDVGLLCLGAAEDKVCTAAATDCGDFPVTALEANEAGSYSTQGSSEGAANLNGSCDLEEAENLAQTNPGEYLEYVSQNCSVGSCGGGGPNAVFSLTAAEATTYTCTVDAGEEDPILYARSYCTVNDPIAELACNDDIDASNRNSAVTLTLEAAETVYLIVDGYGGAFAGAFTITCEPLAP